MNEGTRAPSRTLGPGSKLDRYEIVRPIAQGGMGEVWLARFVGKHGFEKQVALKTILPELAADGAFRRMFLDEARISSRLVHANVAQILDLGEHEGTLFIVFEWVEGLSLEQICAGAEERGFPLAPGIVLRIVADACSGLHAAHELRDDGGESLQVVHRDVKPENVLVRADGCTRVIDFGVAKARHRIAADTKSGVVKGTLQYMAPEQASGKAVDRRADVWSLGGLLYRAFAHGPPFATIKELGDFVLGHSAPPPLPSYVPAGVAGVVRRALERHPGDRYATAEEMRRAVEEAAQESGLGLSQAEVGTRLVDLFPEIGRAGVSSSSASTRIEGRSAEPPPASPTLSPYARTEPAVDRRRPVVTGETKPEIATPLRSSGRARKRAPVRAVDAVLLAVAVLSAIVAIVAWFALK
jgi:serine/threonine-protein kinase